MMDAEAVANRSSYWKLAAALQSFLLLLQKKRLGKENEPGGISISLRTSLKRPEKPLRFFWTFPAITGTALGYGSQQDQCESVLSRKF